MKKLFTKTMAVLAILLLSSWSVNAQTTVQWLLTNPATGTGLTANPASGTEFTAASQTQSTCNVLSWTGYGYDGTQNCERVKTADASRSLPQNFSATTYVEYAITATAGYNLSVSTIDMYLGGGGTSSVYAQIKYSTDDFVTETILDAGGAALVSNSATAITHKTFASLTISVNSGSTLKVRVYPKNTGSASTTKYLISSNVNITFTSAVASTDPAITLFNVAGVNATIDQTAKTITATLPYGTNLASLTPTVTVNSFATGYTPLGLNDFSGTVTYTATGTPDINYSVTLSVAPPSSDKDLSAVTIGSYSPSFDAGINTYSLNLPKASSLSQAVSFTIPATATADFTSGNTHDFTNPLSITVTAQDLSTKVFTLTAQLGIADIAYVSSATTPHANDTKIYPMLLEKGYYVKVIAASGIDLTQFTPYDLVVLCENVSSSNTLALAMNGLIQSQRFLNFKAYMYNKTGWPTGTPSDGSSDAEIAVAADYLSHPIFSGVSLTGNLANILTDPAVKGIQGVLNPSSSSVIANLTSTGNTDKVAIIENNQMPSAKYMLIPIQTDSYAKVNTNGLKLIENAVTYLLSDSKFGPYTGNVNINNSNFSFDGRNILNPDHIQLQVFDITGRLVASSVKDINMSAQVKGVYVVKGENGILKIALTK